MPNYQESPVAGTAWTRATRVVCENPLGGIGRAVTFVEERVVSIGGNQTITQAAGNVVEPLTALNMNETFDLVHPDTGAVIGSSTYGAAFLLLHSLYYHVAAKRDAPPVVPE